MPTQPEKCIECQERSDKAGIKVYCPKCLKMHTPSPKGEEWRMNKNVVDFLKSKGIVDIELTLIENLFRYDLSEEKKKSYEMGYKQGRFDIQMEEETIIIKPLYSVI